METNNFVTNTFVQVFSCITIANGHLKQQSKHEEPAYYSLAITEC